MAFVLAGCGGGGSSDDNRADSGNSAATSSTLATAKPSSADPNEAASYYATGGSAPKLSPDCEDGLFTFCLGSPVERAIEILGPEDERYGSPETVSRQWTIGDAFITIDADAVGSIVGIAASLQEEDPTFRLSLPFGLTLGSSTLAEFSATLNMPLDPAAREEAQGEGYTSYRYEAQFGPEGTLTFEVGYTQNWGYGGDPNEPDPNEATRPATFVSMKG